MKALLAGLLSLPIAAWGSTGAVQAPTSKPAALSLEQQDIRAQLTPRNYTTLAAEIGAKISRIPFKPGQTFKAGQLLVGFDCTLQAAQKARSRAELAGAEKTHAAHRRLAELDAVGQLELSNAETALLKARADVDLANATLSKCNVAAPFSGRVAEQKVREQQYVQPGQPILEILDDSALELEFIAPSKWLAWLRAGHTFKVSIDETGRTYPARVTRLGARIDPVSQSVSVTAVIDGRFDELIAGMSGHVLLTSMAK
jgi:membrane fusion protein (multidrug efflux system)